MNPKSQQALHIDLLCAGYTEEPIIHDISFSLDKGSITTIIGPNGAGKSTLLKGIYGLIKHFSGKILLENTELQLLTTTNRFKLGLGFVPQSRCNFPRMTVKENLELGAYSIDKTKVNDSINSVCEKFPILLKRWKVLAGNLSGGEQQILEMAMVLQTNPKVLLLDEPTLGLSPLNQDIVFETIKSIQTFGVTILVVEQNAFGSLNISDRAIVMELGKIIIEGPAKEITQNPRLRSAYLGSEANPISKSM